MSERPVGTDWTAEQLKIAQLEEDLKGMRQLVHQREQEAADYKNKLAEVRGKNRQLKYLIQAQAKFIHEYTDVE
jgi:hypothetical protein